ncbi:MAG: hypothetical protein ACRDZO_27605, partial [Egibacteraceae bacterium]
PRPVRLTLLAALASTRQGELVDGLVELLIALVHKIHVRAEREATRRYQDSLTIRERLVELAPDNTAFQQILYNAFDRLADLASDDEMAAAACDGVLRLSSGVLGSDHPLTQAIVRRLADPGDRDAE